MHYELILHPFSALQNPAPVLRSQLPNIRSALPFRGVYACDFICNYLLIDDSSLHIIDLQCSVAQAGSYIQNITARIRIGDSEMQVMSVSFFDVVWFETEGCGWELGDATTKIIDIQSSFIMNNYHTVTYSLYTIYSLLHSIIDTVIKG